MPASFSSGTPRTVIVTGSSRGIGFSTAQKFLSSGDNVTIFCRHPEHVNRAKEKLTLSGPSERLLALVGDVQDETQVKMIVDQTVDRFHSLDILINNAGIGLWKPLEETSPDEWDEVLDINLKGYFLFAKFSLPIMKKFKKGTIINISSGLGVRAGEKYSAYAASKFGIVALTQVIAEENQQNGILSYVVLPGGVATKLHLDMHPWESPKEMMTPDHIAEKIFRLAQGKNPSGYQLPIYH